MSYQPKILAFAGSLRKDSYNKRVVRIVAEGARGAGARVDLIELNDFPMPIYNADEQAASGFPEKALEFQRLIGEADGLLISSPEYNGSLSGVLKNSLDWASRASDDYGVVGAFRGKFAGITTASPGAFGGIRSLGHLRSILTVMGVHVLPAEFAVGKANLLFEGDSGEMTDEKMKGLLTGLGRSVAETIARHHTE